MWDSILALDSEHASLERSFGARCYEVSVPHTVWPVFSERPLEKLIYAFREIKAENSLTNKISKK